METAQRQEESIRWEELVLTPEKIAWLWEQTQKFPIIFDDFGKGNYKDFVAKLTSPRNAFADIGPGLGLASIMNIQPGLDALVHIVMFDRRLRGREPVIKDMLKACFDRLKLRRLTALISKDAPLAAALVKRLNFKLEGVMRQAMLRGGQFVDVELYGLLREEL